jgi:opacity protein-like surface antigen
MHAQSDPTAADRPSRSIGVEIGSNSVVGVGFRVGERTDLLLEVGGRATDDGTNETTNVLLRPMLKRYLGAIDRRVVPYLVFGARAEWTRIESAGTQTANFRRLGGLAGVGLDWFPAKQVSVGGHVGVDVVSLRRESTPFLPGDDGVSTGMEVGTFSSGVRLRLFF